MASARLLLVVTIAAIVLALGGDVSADAAGRAAGEVRLVKVANTGFDAYTRDPTAGRQEWMRDHYWRMRVWRSYFDSRVHWFPAAQVYQDLYAIYRDSDEATHHPEWVLRDRDGRRLYIPSGCTGETCPQYAGDVGSPAFRAAWIAEAKATIAKGYLGLFVDDVNMDMRVSDGSGQDVRPVDPRTGEPMTDSDWARYVADFVAEIRQALPGVEIVHNALWWMDHADPEVRRQIDSADYLELERGFNDPGIRGGDGRYGFETFLAHIDWLHSRGKPVLLEEYVDEPAAREYGLAAYFLVNSGRDAVACEMDTTPDDWWRGYETELGAPLGGRYRWRGVFRRDFERGIVLVNQPDEPKRTLPLDRPYLDLAGRRRTSLTLRPARGAILLAAGRDPTSTRLAEPAAAGSGQVALAAAGDAVEVRGRVLTAREGRVRLVTERREGDGWVAVSRMLRRVDSRGRFTAHLEGMRPGAYRGRARYLGSYRSEPSTSPHRRFTVPD